MIVAKLISVRLGHRLQTIANLIEADVHLDIGSDHAQLPLYLLQNGRIQKALVVEKSLSPFKCAQKALESSAAEVRLGDGLYPVQIGEADSLSLSGLGARRIVNILTKHPKRVSPKVVLQANNTAEPLRRWALAKGFHLRREYMVRGFWRYTVLAFEKATGDDATYKGIPKALALRYGPQLLKARHPLLIDELEHQHSYLSKLAPHPQVKEKLRLVEAALAYTA